MQIEIIQVVREDLPSKNGKGTYGQLTVVYKSGGKVQEKKLISFSNPAVFKHIEGMKQGETAEVTTVKNDKGYWDWTNIGGAVATTTESKPAATTNRVTGSNYETKEEREARQRYIIRQSSISSAVAALIPGAKSALDVGDVLRLAKEFETYVFSKSALDMLVDELQDDIPE